MAPLGQALSSVVVGFLLLASGLLFWLQGGLLQTLQHLRAEEVITGIFASPLDDVQEARVLSEVHRLVDQTAPPGDPPQVHYTSVRMLLDRLRTAYPELVQELENLGEDQTQVVPRTISVTGLMPPRFVQDFKRVAGIQSVETTKNRYRAVMGTFTALCWVARILMAGLCLALITGLVHLGRSNGYLYRDSLRLMRIWGAGGKDLLTPGLVCGLISGSLGGFLAATGWISAGRWLVREIRNLSPLLLYMPSLSLAPALVLLAAGVLLGAFAGVLSSILTLSGSGGEPSTEKVVAKPRKAGFRALKTQAFAHRSGREF